MEHEEAADQDVADVTYEGRAYDVKAKRRIPVKIAPDVPGYVLPDEEIFDLDRAEVEQMVRAIEEGVNFSGPGSDADYGESERHDATVAKAMEIRTHNIWRQADIGVRLAINGEDDPFDQRSIEEMQDDADKAKREFKYWQNRAALTLMQYRRAMRLRENRIRLGEMVEAERRARGLTQAEFAKLVKVSLSTYQVIEKSDDPKRGMNVKTAANLEAALGWGLGSVQAVLNGGDPVPEESGMVAGTSVSAGAVVGEREESDAEPSSRFAIRLSDELADELRVQAAKEERTVNRLIESAVRLYLRTMADE